MLSPDVGEGADSVAVGTITEPVLTDRSIFTCEQAVRVATMIIVTKVIILSI
jgi:hypothetical protein